MTAISSVRVCFTICVLHFSYLNAKHGINCSNKSAFKVLLNCFISVI